MSKLLYSIAAIRRLLKLPQTAKIHVQNWFKVLWVWVEGHRPTLISKFALKRHFVERRQEAARSLFVEQFHSNIYFVSHPSEDKSRRRVQLFDGGLTCQCEDFQAQAQVIGRACCKHAYAVLHHLGFDSFSAYISH